MCFRKAASHAGLSSQKKVSPKLRPTVTFDPTCLDPDTMDLDISIPSGSVLVLYGSLVDLVVAFKVRERESCFPMLKIIACKQKLRVRG